MDYSYRTGICVAELEEAHADFFTSKVIQAISSDPSALFRYLCNASLAYYAVPKMPENWEPSEFETERFWLGFYVAKGKIPKLSNDDAGSKTIECTLESPPICQYCSKCENADSGHWPITNLTLSEKIDIAQDMNPACSRDIKETTRRIAYRAMERGDYSWLEDVRCQIDMAMDQRSVQRHLRIIMWPLVLAVMGALVVIAFYAI